MKTLKITTLLLIAAGLAIVPLASYAQIIIIPGLCPPGFVFVPPNSCEPIPPTPILLNPIILIPGITVSQNKKLLYKDEESDKWKFAFGFNVYKGLIKKLESAGYEEGKDLFIAHYDWRKPAAHNATTYLKPIINQAKQATSAGKVDVVAHSFGGIVARAYIQSDDYANDIDQLITLGSPHQGSADAYVAWEGGLFPEGWFFLTTRKIEKVEKALKKSRNQPNIKRPESFRAFFPSLRDMLPLQDFVNREGSLLAITDLVEQNSFLKNLHNTFSSIAAKSVSLTTIAGTKIKTLGQVNVASERTSEDETLNRWRDGRANPELPPLDSTAGDTRVLLSSAHIGSKKITLNNAVHHKLPDEAQNQVFDILGLEPQPLFFSTFPKKTYSVVVLSPVEVVIVGPNGATLSQNQNDFGPDNAEYDDDPDDPDDPIELNIANPPDGWYTTTYTGTDSGEYTIITSYADKNKVVTIAKDGTTFLNQQWTERFYIDGEIFIPATSLLELTKQLKQTIKQLHKDQHLTHHGKLYGKANKLDKDTKKYIKDLDKHEADDKKTQKSYDKLQKSFAGFSKELDKEIAKDHLNSVAVQQLTDLREQIENALPQ